MQFLSKPRSRNSTCIFRLRMANKNPAAVSEHVGKGDKLIKSKEVEKVNRAGPPAMPGGQLHT